MPVDLVKLNQIKDKIQSIIRVRGPSLPNQVATSINVEPLFASAYLAELYSEKKLKITNMKIGSSPLYYIPGQENLLENFIDNLNTREKEAILLLQKEGILEDDKLQPVTRVALRSLKDFANPFRVKLKEETKLLWKYYLISEQEFTSQIQDAAKRFEKTTKKEKPETIQKPEENLTKQQAIPIDTQRKIIDKPKPKTKPTEFSNYIKSNIKKYNLQIQEIMAEKKREFEARVQAKDIFGNQSYYLIAKDKKKISDNDLSLAHLKAQSYNMPSIVLSSGELTKKAKDHLEKWSDLIKFKQIQ